MLQLLPAAHVFPLSSSGFSDSISDSLTPKNAQRRRDFSVRLCAYQPAFAKLLAQLYRLFKAKPPTSARNQKGDARTSVRIRTSYFKCLNSTTSSNAWEAFPCLELLAPGKALLPALQENYLVNPQGSECCL